MLSVSTNSSRAQHHAHSGQAHILALKLNRTPFPVTPDDEQAFFFSSRLNEMYGELEHFIQLRKGFMLVTGDVGVGKTTLTRLLLSRLEKLQSKSALIINTFLQDIELFRAISRDFNLVPDDDTLDGHLQCLNAFLLNAYSAGYNCVLIIDDAQRLSINSLELIRQLSNLETAHDKLLQIVLVAQPEIMETLDRFDLRQLRSRIALHVRLLPLTLEEMDQYLHHRLSLAGSNSTIKVSPSAMRELFAATAGFPRLIHMVMDRCLFGLCVRESKQIDVRLMRQAIVESDLRRSTFPVRRLRTWGVIGSVAALSVAGILIGGWAYTVLQAEPESQIPVAQPAVNIIPPANMERPEWRQFIDAHPGLQSAPISELHEYTPSALDDLATTLAPYQWVPALIAPTEKSCQGGPTFPLQLASGQRSALIFFKTDFPMTLLPYSQHDKQIELLQLKLLALNYMDEEEVDGVMGPRTGLALARFQKASGLPGTGQADVQSSYALECAQVNDQVRVH